MTDAAIPQAFTKAMVDAMMASAYAAGNQPKIILVAPYQRAVFVTIDTADREQWDWRRTKRELRRLGLTRKGVRREYHKKPRLDG